MESGGCRCAVVSPPHALIAWHSRIGVLSRTLSEVLIRRAAHTTAYLVANLLKHLVGEVGSHFVLENRDLFNHHLGVFSLAILQLTQHTLQLLPHHIVLLHQVFVGLFQLGILHVHVGDLAVF